MRPPERSSDALPERVPDVTRSPQRTSLAHRIAIDAPPRPERGKPQRRRRFDDEPVRRGRLTEEERERLTALREEPDPLTLPGDAEPWSTWDTGERGPSPHPERVVTELPAVDHEFGILKNGKEADAPAAPLGAGNLRGSAAGRQRYRDGDHRMFHRDAGFWEGRRMRCSRRTGRWSGVAPSDTA